MTAISFMRKSFVAIALSIFFASACAQAQSGKSEYQPQVGQEGKDVIWVPTPQSLVDKMLDIAKVTREGLRYRSRLRRRPHGHYRGEARRESARHRIQSRHG